MSRPGALALPRGQGISLGHMARNAPGGRPLLRLFGQLPPVRGGEQCARDLRDAHEFLSAARIRHPQRRVDADRPVDNRLRPRELSNFERTRLNDALQIVRERPQVPAARDLV